VATRRSNDDGRDVGKLFIACEPADAQALFEEQDEQAVGLRVAKACGKR